MYASYVRGEERTIGSTHAARIMAHFEVNIGDTAELRDHFGDGMGLRCTEVDRAAVADLHGITQGCGTKATRGIAYANVIPPRTKIAKLDEFAPCLELSNQLRKQMRIGLAGADHVEEPDDHPSETALRSDISQIFLALQFAEAINVVRTDCRLIFSVRLVRGLVDRAAAGQYRTGIPPDRAAAD